MKIHEGHRNLVKYCRDMKVVSLNKKQRRKILKSEASRIGYQLQRNALHNSNMAVGYAYTPKLRHIRKVARVKRYEEVFGVPPSELAEFSVETIHNRDYNDEGVASALRRAINEEGLFGMDEKIRQWHIAFRQLKALGF